MIAIDTDVLVYGHRAALPEHRAARRALERAVAHGGGWGIAQPVLAEFWSVVTHPAAAGRPSTPSEARAFLDALVRDGGAQVWLPAPGFHEQLFRAAVDGRVAGPRIFDLQIALLARAHGAEEIWTHDRRFLAVPGLRVVDPLATTR